MFRQPSSKLSAKEWLQIHLQRLANSADFRVRVGLLVLLSLANILVGALMYKAASGKPWTSSIFTVYSVLFSIPGSNVTGEHGLLATAVINIIFLFGLLVFAVLLGMVAEEVAMQVMSLRSGKGVLRLRDHILILNWNTQVMSVIGQILSAQRDHSHPFHGKKVVILAHRPKEEMAAALSDLSTAMGIAVEVHTRMGQPYRVEDLALVSAAHAAYTLLMYPEPPRRSSSSAGGGGGSGAGGGSDEKVGYCEEDQSDAEALKAATVAALSTLDNFAQRKLVIQVPFDVSSHFKQLDVVQQLLEAEGSSIHIVRLPEQSVIDRLLAQTALQPGVVTVFKSVLRYGSTPREFRWIPIPDSTHPGADVRSLSYGSVRRHCCQGMPVGYVCATEQKLHINPEEGAEVYPGDMLLVLQAGPASSTTLVRSEPPFFTAACKASDTRTANLDRSIVPPGVMILVAGWPENELQELAAGFVGFAPPDSKVRFLLKQPAEQPPESEANVVFEYEVVEDPLAAATLLDHGIEHADAVVLAAPSGLSYPDSDALILSTLFQIQQLMSGCNRMVHVVAKAASPSTKEIAENFFKSLPNRAVTFELVTPHQLTSAILTRVACQPFFMPLCRELMMTAEGNELYILGFEQLGFMSGEEVTIAECMEMARRLEMSLLGIAKRAGTQQLLAPAPDMVVVLESGDKFIVVADLVN